MPGFLKSLSAPLAFGSLVILAVVSMVADRSGRLDPDRQDLPWWQGVLLEVAIPVQKVLAAPANAVSQSWDSYIDLVGVREENERLRLRLAELEEANLQFREALVASGHLDRIAAMRDDFEVPMQPSEVVGLDVSPFFRSVLVDRGSRHGIRPGSPVITDEGVVGVVTRTSPHAAKTMLVLDRQSRVDAVIQRNRARGMVSGNGSGELGFEFVVLGSDVQIGDRVITSGLGGVYPKGLDLGEITTISDRSGSLVQSASLKPAVDFGRLEQVFVMLRVGPTMELLYGGDAPPLNASSESEEGPGIADAAAPSPAS